MASGDAHEWNSCAFYKNNILISWYRFEIGTRTLMKMLLQWYCKSVIAKISENVSITKVGSDAYIFFKKGAIH